MKEHPILFSAPMVRALLAGTKTQTRRLVKMTDRARAEIGDRPVTNAAFGYARWEGSFDAKNYNAWCPYADAPGDRLWVRETWRVGDGMNPSGDPSKPTYAADWPDAAVKWKPSIHMPRAASRITLEVTDVRVERLQDISEEDAKAEGVERARFWDSDDKWEHDHDPSYAPPLSSYVGAFEALWDAINGDRAPWATNPWVWVVSFKRIDAAGSA